MGIKHYREYEEIIQDLMSAIYKIEDFYDFLGMKSKVWESMGKQEQLECLKTLADDIFFGLDAELSMDIGQGSISYDEGNICIKVFNEEKCVGIVSLK